MAGVMAVCMDVMDRPWRWGEADCCTAACDVFLRMHGVDPMEPLRGRYSTYREARRVISQEGGWLPMAESLASRSGLTGCAGMVGCIGVVRDARGALALGILTELGWAGKTEHGMAVGGMLKGMRAWCVA